MTLGAKAPTPPPKPVGPPNTHTDNFGNSHAIRGDPCSHPAHDSILTRLRQRVARWWQRNSPQHARMIRDNALLNEVVGWLPEHYGAEVKRIVMEYSKRPEGWWR